MIADREAPALPGLMMDRSLRISRAPTLGTGLGTLGGSPEARRRPEALRSPSTHGERKDDHRF